MSTAEKYLKPEVIQQIKRLDLRAQFIVKGFLQGLHASPFHGFSVEFSEHRKYTPGDDPKDIDWLIYAKTDKYYVKKFEAETNITGYLVMDLSRSMGYTYRQELTKFDYSICLAAALCYLMIHQQDPVGLLTFDEKIRNSLAPKSRRGQLGDVLSLLANLKPEGKTDVAASLNQVAAMLRHASLVMIFPICWPIRSRSCIALQAQHGGHDVILFPCSMKPRQIFRSAEWSTWRTPETTAAPSTPTLSAAITSTRWKRFARPTSAVRPVGRRLRASIRACPSTGRPNTWRGEGDETGFEEGFRVRGSGVFAKEFRVRGSGFSFCHSFQAGLERAG